MFLWTISERSAVIQLVSETKDRKSNLTFGRAVSACLTPTSYSRFCIFVRICINKCDWIYTTVRLRQNRFNCFYLPWAKTLFDDCNVFKRTRGWELGIFSRTCQIYTSMFFEFIIQHLCVCWCKTTCQNPVPPDNFKKYNIKQTLKGSIAHILSTKMLLFEVCFILYYMSKYA